MLNLERPQAAFTTTGFSNWKKSIEKFTEHQKSGCHKQAVYQLEQSRKAPPVLAQLSDAHRRQQATARRCLMKVLQATKYLLRQGLAYRGHSERDGNLYQLLKIQTEDDSDLAVWLEKSTNFMSHECIDEIQNMFSHRLLRGIVADIKCQSKIFAVVVDGTQDITSKEQLSICIRYVDSELQVIEDFVGLYQIAETTGHAIAETVEDALLRLGLDASLLRGQTYDGGANMAGTLNGCQAVLRRKYPLALHFHCAAHCVHLVAERASESDVLVRDCLQWVHELGKLYKRSTKFNSIFQAVVSETDDSSSPSAHIKPLCPTRWLCRHPAVVSVVDKYTVILDSLREMADSQHSETAVKAQALHDKFSNGTMLLGLRIAMCFTAPLHELSRVLQARRESISGMVECVKAVRSDLDSKRNDEYFREILQDVQKQIEEFDLDELKLPRAQKPPRRITGPAPSHQATTVEEYFRKSFFSVIDTAMQQIDDRWQASTGSGLQTYLKLEEMLLTGQLASEDCDVIDTYQELDRQALSVQLNMFLQHYKPRTLYCVKQALQSMSSDSRLLFSQVEQLVRLLLVCPATSCEAERSFSALRRLKTWLRNSISQLRLNSSAVCHVHKDRLDNLSARAIAADFASRTETRRNAFGHFCE